MHIVHHDVQKSNNVGVLEVAQEANLTDHISGFINASVFVDVNDKIRQASFAVPNGVSDPALLLLFYRCVAHV